MLTATALWNLLDVYRKDPVPKEFSKLLLAVLALDVERARELHIQPPHWVFPPFPEDARLDPDTYAEFGATPLVAESSFTVRRNKKSEPFRAHANLQLCVRRDFDRLRFLAQPERWPELCSVIWTDMKREEVDIWKGGLRLPGIPEQEVIDVTFKDATISEPDANKMVVELTLAAPPFIEAGYLKFRMEPERERPGWTRIIHDREVTFFSELHRYEVPTLAYWTKSEIACLALS